MDMSTLLEIIGGSALISSSVLFYKIVVAPRYSVLNRIPGPKPTSLLMGNFPEISSEEVCEPQLRWAQQYGDIVKYSFIFNSPSVLITGEKELKHVLITNARNYHYQLTGRDSLVTDSFGEGLLFIEGDVHAQHKRMVQPVFNYAHLKDMVPIFMSRTNDLIERFKKHMAEGNSYFEMSKEMSNLALDVIGLAAFTYDFDAVHDDNGEMTEKYRTFMHSFELNPSLFIPHWRKLPTPGNLKLKEAMKKIDEVLFDIIGKKQEQMKNADNQTGKNFDMLDLLLRAKDPETDETLNAKQVHNHVMTFMLAGHETTATALAWLIYNLAQHPEVERKFCEELDSLKGKQNLTYDDFEKLPYLENIIKETLRLHPSAPITTRLTVEDDVISGYQIPKGTRIVICPGVQHRMEKYWGPDAAVFNPDRWSDPKIKDLPQYAYMPFLMGPRQCIGHKFAKIEMKVIISLLYMNFSFKLQEGLNVQRKLMITMKPFPNLMCSVTPRE